MILEKSYVVRPSGEGSISHIETGYHCPSHNVDHVCLTLSFDIGTKQKHEKVRVIVDADDFGSLISEMINHNQAAFLSALDSVLVPYKL